MTSALQNRLVGTVILVALAVIFLPDFLDRKKESSTDTFVSVPATPAKKPIVDPEPFPSQRAANLSQRPIDTVEEPVVDDSVPVVPKPMVKEVTSKPEDDLASQTVVSKPATESDDGGWVVQLGSFRHEKNVKQLLDKLEKAGYRAFSRPIETRSGPLTKVFVGPEMDKKKLQGALPHLQEVTGLKGKVTTFKVN